MVQTPASTSRCLTLPGGAVLPLSRPLIVGILNVTPDSFSDGGAFPDAAAALAQARRMLEEGATIIDVGGESTRPGARRIPAAEQNRRILPVIQGLKALLQARRSPAGGLPGAISVDTTLTAVAAAALEAGAAIINDVSAGRDDPGMFALAAGAGAPLVLMHMQGDPGTMQANPAYGDVVAEVRAFLLERAAAAQAAGVPRGQIVIDPGIGFGKTVEHNLSLLAHLETLVATGFPVMLGASRKSFLGAVCVAGGAGPAVVTPPAGRLAATCATTVLAVQAGVSLVRVHDVEANRQALEVACRVRAAMPGEPKT